jgi:ketosteroid isomerase-like protein
MPNGVAGGHCYGRGSPGSATRTEEPLVDSSDAQVVRRAYDAFTRGDMPSMLANFSPDIHWHSPEGTPWGGTYDSPKEVVELFRRIVVAVDSVRLRVDRIDVAGPGRVLVEGTNHYMIDGQAVEVPFAHDVLVREGAICGLTEYADVSVLTPVVGTTALGVAR